MMESAIPFTGLQDPFFLKNISRESFYKFQREAMLVARSMNAAYLLIRKRLT